MSNKTSFRPKVPLFVWATGALLFTFMVLLFAWLPLHIQEKEVKEIELAEGEMIRAWVEIPNEHIHLGDVFSFTVQVLYRADAVDLDKQALAQGVEISPFEERDVHIEEKSAGRNIKRYTLAYHLQALGKNEVKVFPFKLYPIGITTVPYVVKYSGEEKVLEFNEADHGKAIFVHSSLVAALGLVVDDFSSGSAPLKGKIVSLSALMRTTLWVLAGLWGVVSLALILQKVGILRGKSMK